MGTVDVSGPMRAFSSELEMINEHTHSAITPEQALETPPKGGKPAGLETCMAAPDKDVAA